MIKSCLQCGKEFKVKPSHFYRRKCCSFVCVTLYKKGKPNLKLQGVKHCWRSPTQFVKDDPRITGRNNPNWKGDNVGYMALHSYVDRNFSKPAGCEFCGKISADKYVYDWANISKEYKRDRSDWYYLCRKCHHKYDNRSEKMWETRRGAILP